MPKFTPGPWKYEKVQTKTTTFNGPYIDILATGPVSEVQPAIAAGRTNDEAQYNARLIAKGPPMYALLRILAEAFSESGEYPYMEKTIKDLLAEIDGE